jgi:dCMP deaminase
MKKKMIEAHMKVAETYAQQSYAQRLQVGCIIVKSDTVIGIGYNGMPSGWHNNCEYTLYDDLGNNKGLKTRPEVLHAESNALMKVAKSTNSSDGASLFVTHAPCIDCAKLIHQAGIREVFYRNSYRDEVGIYFLQQCNIKVTKLGE